MNATRWAALSHVWTVVSLTFTDLFHLRLTAQHERSRRDHYVLRAAGRCLLKTDLDAPILVARLALLGNAGIGTHPGATPHKESTCARSTIDPSRASRLPLSRESHQIRMCTLSSAHERTSYLPALPLSTSGSDGQGVFRFSA